MGMEWYVLRVQAGKEDRVKDALEKKAKIAGFEDLLDDIYIPKRDEAVIKDGKKRVKQVKIYPGYLYVHADLYDGDELRDDLYYMIKETQSVGDFVHTLGRPIPMSAEDVDKIFNRAPKPEEVIADGDSDGGDEGDSAGQPSPVVAVDIPFKPGDRVKIKEGHAFENFDGTVEEVIPEKGIVKVIVVIFGRDTQVELGYWEIQEI